MMRYQLKIHNILTSLIIPLYLGIFGVDGAQAITFRPPEEGAPEDSSSASSRGGKACDDDHYAEQSLISSFVPVIPQSGYGTTLQKHPRILLYVSETGTNEGLFSIKSSDNSTHYEKIVSLPETSGIVVLQVPPEIPALSIGENYKWYFSLVCKDSWKPRYPVQGQIKRIHPPSPLTAVSQQDSIGTAASYGQAGIWYDAAAIMFNLKNQYPQNIDFTKHWDELLNSVGLTIITDAEPKTAP